MTKTVGVVFWEVMEGWSQPTTYSYEISDADHAVATKGDVVMVNANGNIRFPHIVEVHKKPCKKATKVCKLMRNIVSAASYSTWLKKFQSEQEVYGASPAAMVLKNFMPVPEGKILKRVRIENIAPGGIMWFDESEAFK